MIDHKTVSMLAWTFPYHLSKKTLISLQCSSVSHLFSRFLFQPYPPGFPGISQPFPHFPPTNGTEVKALREQLPSEDQKKMPPVPASESKAEKAASLVRLEMGGIKNTMRFRGCHCGLWKVIFLRSYVVTRWILYGLLDGFIWFLFGYHGEHDDEWTEIMAINYQIMF